MSLVKINQELLDWNAAGLLSRDELIDALVEAIGEIPKDYRDAVVIKIWKMLGLGMPNYIAERENKEVAV